MKAYFLATMCLRLVSDNGSQFASLNFEEFAKRYGFRHNTSSPRYPQANGEVEKMVQTINRLVLKTADPHLALLAHLATPGITGKSPSEILMGQRPRTRVPMLPQHRLQRCVDAMQVVRKDLQQREKQRRAFNRRYWSRNGTLQAEGGNKVRVTDRQARTIQLSPTQPGQGPAS